MYSFCCNAFNRDSDGRRERLDEERIKALGRMKNSEALLLKQQDYQARLESFKNATDERDLERFADLRRLDEEQGQVSGTLTELQQRLKAFADLPADLQLARLKVEEQRMELQRRLQDRNDLLSNIVT